MKFRVTETCEYEVEACDRAAAEELFLEYGPPIDGDGVEHPVVFLGVRDRAFNPVTPI